MAAGRTAAAASGAWILFEDEAGRPMTPPRGKTWGRGRPDSGGAGSWTRLRPGPDGGHDLLQDRQRSRLIHAVREHNGRKNQPKGFGRRDFRDLILRARFQFGGPIVLVWDNVRIHLTAPLEEFIEADAGWLTVFQLPT